MAKTKGRKKRTRGKWHQQRKNALARRNRRNARLAEKRAKQKFSKIAKTKGRKKRITSKKGRKSRRKRRRVRINKDGTVNKQDLKLPSLASMMRDNPWMKQEWAKKQAKKGGRSLRF